MLAEGLEEVGGAVAFILGLPPDLPRAIASSSSMTWIRTHLDHLGLAEHFGDKVFSGAEHVARGKPAPDPYLHAAQALGVDIARTVIIEDLPVGVRGAVASGAEVIGLCAGRHCLPGHAERLRAASITSPMTGEGGARLELVAAVVALVARMRLCSPAAMRTPDPGHLDPRSAPRPCADCW